MPPWLLRPFWRMLWSKLILDAYKHRRSWFWLYVALWEIGNRTEFTIQIMVLHFSLSWTYREHQYASSSSPLPWWWSSPPSSWSLSSPSPSSSSSSSSSSSIIIHHHHLSSSPWASTSSSFLSYCITTSLSPSWRCYFLLHFSLLLQYFLFSDYIFRWFCMGLIELGMDTPWYTIQTGHHKARWPYPVVSTESS